MCDDGDAVDGDGCSSTCAVENGYECTGGDSIKGDTCKLKVATVICGDGKRGVNEACDDGNERSGDGCSSSCVVESGFKCVSDTFTSIDTCTKASVCGNGKREDAELCDDGNTFNGDGCSTTCVVESGFTCVANSGGNDVCSSFSQCGGIKCLNGAKCFVDSKTSKAHCDCVKGTYGQLCEQDAVILSAGSVEKRFIPPHSLALFSFTSTAAVKRFAFTMTKPSGSTAPAKLLLSYDSEPEFNTLGTYANTVAIEKNSPSQVVGISPDDMKAGIWYAVISNDGEVDGQFSIKVDVYDDDIIRQQKCVSGLVNVNPTCDEGYKITEILDADLWTETSSFFSSVSPSVCNDGVDMTSEKCHTSCISAGSTNCVGKTACVIADVTKDFCVKPTGSCTKAAGFIMEFTCVPVANEACSPTTCNGNGNCFTVSGFARCECQTGWLGSYCETKKPDLSQDTGDNKTGGGTAIPGIDNSVIIYAGAGAGVLLVIIVVFIVMRRRGGGNSSGGRTAQEFALPTINIYNPSVNIKSSPGLSSSGWNSGGAMMPVDDALLQNSRNLYETHDYSASAPKINKKPSPYQPAASAPVVTVEPIVVKKTPPPFTPAAEPIPVAAKKQPPVFNPAPVAVAPPPKKSPPKTPPARLPPGWQELVDPASGSKYYFNEYTGESSWEIPKPSSPGGKYL
jgi:cysteine-rich repeat protein